MGRKKVKEEEQSSGGEYDVLIGYVHEFAFINEHHADGLLGHPRIGRVYRLIKAPSGYRLHIGRDNNDAGLDGLFLGDNLEGENKNFLFKIEVVTPDNYLKLDIDSDDYNQIAEWVTNGNKDLWDQIEKESSGAVPVIKNLADFLAFIRQAKEENNHEESNGKAIIPTKGIISHISKDLLDPDEDDKTTVEYVDAERISNALNVIQEWDYPMLQTISYLVDYIASCYGDKYENGNMPNFSKWLATNSKDLGKGANLFNAMKYVQRYSTTGFAKSDNIQDLQKAIHYLMFELQRRNTINE